MDALRNIASRATAAATGDGGAELSAEAFEEERQSLLQKTSDAVKAVQKAFAGQGKMAISSDANTACLCAQLEAILCHGLRANKKKGAEVTFWPCVKELLTLEDAHRINTLGNITTDSGRGRAWLRECLNEQSLQQQLTMLADSQAVIGQHYIPGAFLADEERTNMLAMLCKGLESTFFALDVDTSDINGQKIASGSTAPGGASAAGTGHEKMPRSTSDGVQAVDDGSAFVAVHEHVAHPSVMVVQKKKKSKKKSRRKSRNVADIGGDPSDSKPVQPTPEFQPGDGAATAVAVGSSGTDGEGEQPTGAVFQPAGFADATVPPQLAAPFATAGAAAAPGQPAGNAEPAAEPSAAASEAPAAPQPGSAAPLAAADASGGGQDDGTMSTGETRVDALDREPSSVARP